MTAFINSEGLVIPYAKELLKLVPNCIQVTIITHQANMALYLLKHVNKNDFRLHVLDQPKHSSNVQQIEIS